ncbi:MAG TPA: hypothetical protein VFL83_06965 [Anaeromyxobacter sp.]|nr:hypothetical protein [Anaeromyxobacter sp.]
MSSELESFLSFLDGQQRRQASRFPGLAAGQVLGFMGTTSLPGTFAACSVNRLVRIERAATPRDLRVVLAGPLARAPRRGECVAVHMTRVERYQGYQVKTRALAAGVAEADLVEPGPDGLVVKGAQIFTVHHSPYTLRFFENVPFEDVEDTVAGLPCALVAIGETANLSPRFVFHHEVKDGKVMLFHGDGLALKTYMNVRVNRNETRLMLDLDDWSGWSLRGTVEEFAPHQHPEAYERICRGFTAGSWGKPSRAFRFVPESFEPIRPA